MTKNYRLENIRTLLNEGFTDEELRYLCYDMPGFRPVYNQLSQNTGKSEIIHRLVEHSDRKLQIETLLTLVKERNPARYEFHQPYDDSTSSPPSQGKTPQQHQIKINLPGLLQMLGSNIYAEPDVAVREMISNAHDTCIVRQSQQTSFTTPQIHLTYDQATRTLTFSDNGAGMTETELHDYLSTIGASFAKWYRENAPTASVEMSLALIGQFGIGLLSAFSIANKVEIFTRSYLPGSLGFKWVCQGDIHYTVERIDKSEVGTQVVLHLNEKGMVLLGANANRLKQSIKRYHDFTVTPIF